MPRDTVSNSSQFNSSLNNNSSSNITNSNKTQVLSLHFSLRSQTMISCYKCPIFLRIRTRLWTQTSRCKVSISQDHRMFSSRSILRELLSIFRASSINLTRMMSQSRNSSHPKISHLWVLSWHRSTTIRSKTSWKSLPKILTTKLRSVLLSKHFPGVSPRFHLKLEDKICTLTSISIFLSWRNKSQIQSFTSSFLSPDL